MSIPEEKVNINTADLETLTNIPMLGKYKAELIIKERPFSSWDEFVKAAGLSRDVIDDMKRMNVVISEKER